MTVPWSRVIRTAVRWISSRFHPTLTPSDNPDTIGLAGEELAGRYLQRAGLTILERRFRCPRGEIDLIALDDEILVFIEVKTRKTARPAFANHLLRGRQRRRIQAAAAWYRRKHRLVRRSFRFDLVLVVRSHPPTVHWFPGLRL